MKKICTLLLVLVLSFSVLTGCGKRMELAGTIWQYNDIYCFQADGSVMVYDANGNLYETITDGTYTWNGKSGEMNVDGENYRISLSKESDSTLVISDLEKTWSYGYEQLDELPDPYPTEATSGSIADTIWDYGISHYAFYADGKMEHIEDLTGADVRIGTYEWDDELGRGSFTIDGKTQLICLDSEGYYLYFQDPDDRSAFHIIYDSRTLGDEITD